MKKFWKEFLMCGIIGWTMECFWTGLHSFIQKDHQLWCTTSLWMFPIYGMAACLCPLFCRLKEYNALLRSFIYAILIFIGEFFSGMILKSYKAIPWNYEHARFNINGIIRLDYLPAWMLAGLIFEKIMLKYCECDDPEALPVKKWTENVQGGF